MLNDIRIQMRCCAFALALEFAVAAPYKAIAMKEKEIERLHELRARLISDVVTGQMDVRDIEVPDFAMVEETDSDEESLDDENAAEEIEEQEE